MTHSNSNSKIRETFGIIDPLTKQKYKDIKRSFLELRRITKEDLLNREILEPSTRKAPYLLHTDLKVNRIIFNEGYCDCIVSYQERTTGRIALARIFIKKEEE